MPNNTAIATDALIAKVINTPVEGSGRDSLPKKPSMKSVFSIFITSHASSLSAKALASPSDSSSGRRRTICLGLRFAITAKFMLSRLLLYIAQIRVSIAETAVTKLNITGSFGLTTVTASTAEYTIPPRVSSAVMLDGVGVPRKIFFTPAVISSTAQKQARSMSCKLTMM